MPSVQQKRVGTLPIDFPVNEAILPMFALSNLGDRRFVVFATHTDIENLNQFSAGEGAAEEGFYIKPYPATAAATTKPGVNRVVGVTYNEVIYPPHTASTENGIFRIIDPGTRLQQVSVFTAGVIRVRK